MMTGMKNNMDVIEAAGGLLWQETHEGCKIAIIHRPKYDDWTLPKGKREVGETWQETALREVYEETGYHATTEKFAGGIIYQVNNVPKVVLFWNMKILNNQNFTPNNEIDQCKWVLVKDAYIILSYENERKLLHQFL